MKIYITIVFCLFPLLIHTQIFGPQQLVGNISTSVDAVDLADLDGDNNIDLIVSYNNFIVWHKNLDGLGNFGPAIEIALGLGLGPSIHIADINGDAHLDIVFPSGNQDRVLWLANDGTGNFSNPVVITDSVDVPYDVISADIDGDGDLDIIVSADVEDTLYWHENMNGDGLLWVAHLVTDTGCSGRSSFAGDIDGDGDIDIATSAPAWNYTLAWFENLDGNGTFGTERIIAGPESGVEKIEGLDIDNDGDFDIVAATPADNKLAWFENMDGLGNFGTEQIISNETVHANDIDFADLDNDGDYDLVSIGAQPVANAKMAYYINLDGLGNFSGLQLIQGDFGGSSTLVTGDIDGDGDKDVATSLAYFNQPREISWYENLTILNVTDIEALGIKIYPNPVKEELVIESPITITKVTLYSVLGNKLLEVSKDLNEISLISLPSGMLLVELETEKGTIIEKILKE
ncbi:MAG: T9SS type A sorting domain-containing protein [Flavobacteriaceae bacterium]